MPSALIRPAVEAEGAIRAWLRTTAPVGNRWYFGGPVTVVYPLGIVNPPSSVVPVPGGVVPLWQATVHLDLWGAEARERYNLATLATNLCTAIESMPSGTPMGPAAVGQGGHVVSGPRWQPDPDDGKARFVTVAEFTIRPVTGG